MNYVALIPPVTKGPVINKPFISQKLLSFFNLLRGSLVRIMYEQIKSKVMTKIMRTLWDESAELTDEAMASDASVLSDSYTSGDVKDVTETIEGGNQEADDFNEKNDAP